jgi:hypothetical protein
MGGRRAEPVAQLATTCVGARLFIVETPLRRGRRRVEEEGVGGGCGEEAGVE